MKQELLDGLKYMEELPPSKWNAAKVYSFKVNFLPKLKRFIEESGEVDWQDPKAWESKPVTSINGD
jgi:hypothetical protein